jgi:hypothetical protein
VIQFVPSRLAPRYVQSTAVKKFIHFACWFGALRSGIWWTKKSTKFLRISELWHFFQIPHIPLLSAPNQHEKWINYFIQALHRPLQHPLRRSRYTLHAGLEHWKVEYGELKKSTKFLRISESDTFFQIRHIPLLSAPIQHAKWINYFQPSITQVLTTPGQKWPTLQGRLD